MEQKILIASSSTRVPALATAIIKEIKKEGSVYIQALGAGAINQMIKAVTTAGIYLDEKNKTMVCKPTFERTEHDRNAIRILVTVIEEE